MNKDDSRYTPIPCAIYSQYKLAIMHRQSLKLVWHDQAQTHIATVTPLDLQTKQGQEFLIARDQGGHELHIRLDYIHSQTRLG